MSVAFNLITDMDDEVYSFFTVSKDQVLNIGLPSQVTLEGCVGPSLKIFGTPPTKVSGFKGIGHSVGFEMTGEVEYFEAFSADAGVSVDIGISSLKIGKSVYGFVYWTSCFSLCRGHQTVFTCCSCISCIYKLEL